MTTRPLTSFILLALFSRQAEANKLDYGLGIYSNSGTQEIQFKNQTTELDTFTNSAQFFVSSLDWSLSAMFQSATEDDDWSTANTSSTANYKQSGFEISASYYIQDWSLSLAYGQSDSELKQVEYLARPNLAMDIISEQSSNRFSSEDRFWQLSASRWFELSQWNENLAATLEASVGYFDNSANVGRSLTINQNQYGQQAEQFIERFEQRHGQSIPFGEALLPTFDSDSSQWQLGLGVSLDYLQSWWNKDWIISTWLSTDWLIDDDNSLTAIRNGRGPNAIRQTISLDDSLESGQQQVTSAGLDLSVNITSSFSISAGLSDSDIASRQYQFSLFYNF